LKKELFIYLDKLIFIGKNGIKLKNSSVILAAEGEKVETECFF
jgi:hypothetical protein